MRMFFFYIVLFWVSCIEANSQSCSNLGQTPSTAFPVCGTDIFSQSSVPVCSNGIIPTSCANDGNVYQDKNPYWYKFTCFQSGTLGFLISPNNQGDDYDWQLFDVTDRNVNDLFSDPSMIVSYDWSGETGNTGASSAGNSLFVCGSTFDANGNPGPYRPLFTKRPLVYEGHKYLLMISHFSGDQQSGYKLSFGGGTASITDTTNPKLQGITTNCDASQLRVKLNKKMKCPSLAADGSDFILSPATVTITNAVAASCSRGFDMDSVLITLSSPLPVGNYKLTIVNGSDGNTLKDNCDRTIPIGDSLNFIVTPPQPTSLDSIVPLKCAPNTLQLVFRKPIACSTIAADGSDFTITGSQPVSIIGASADCSDGLSSIINVRLSAPIVTSGNFTIHLVPGIDGNTIIDECGFETPVGQSLSFSVKDTVSAAFSYTIDMGCKRDTINYFHNGNNGINKWTWVFDETDTMSGQGHSLYYPATGEHTAHLTVSNGFCTDTSSVHISLNNEVTVNFEMPDIICPEDSASFINKSSGPIDSWSWTFGDGHTSSLQTPPAEHYPLTGKEKYYSVGLTVNSLLGCNESLTKTLRVLGSCYIAVPSAFTPNHDGINDYLYPLNALKARQLVFRVYNRWGQLVFHSNDWQSKWDGTLNGVPQSTGTYVWLLQFTHWDTGKKVEMKGTTTLIR
ncbi:MAG: gliding motility-associated C-terminal domain-containing protein [Bacteroidetes bacterium]|nr:gliding motility-associated C-terminal domain-containing protein [Bacteroidota bacterium]